MSGAAGVAKRTKTHPHRNVSLWGWLFYRTITML